jgi:hypothetical protein
MQHLALTCASDAPRSASKALQRSDAEEWHSGEKAEIVSYLEQSTWHSCELLEGRQPLPSHFVYAQKRGGRYKARLVAGGHKQQQGVDFDETLYRSIRMMLAVAAHECLELRQFDIKTAFSNGYLKEEAYIHPPHGWKHLAGSGRVLRLDRALYGLRQASRAWNKRLEAELTAHGLVQSDADPALWIMHGGGHVMTIFYVDDGMVAAQTAAEADALVDLVAGMFSVHKLGEPQDMSGIEISRDRDAGRITIRQATKAQSLATAFGVEGERCATPMTPVVYGELQAAREGDDMADKEAYQSGIGSMLHMAQCVRPDIAAPVGALAAFYSADCGTLCGDAQCHPLRRLHFGSWHHLRPHRCARRDVVRCEFCSLSRYEAQCVCRNMAQTIFRG